MAHQTGKMTRVGTQVKNTASDRVFNIINLIFWIVLLIVILYPLYLILIASFSDPYAVLRSEVLFWPKDVSLTGYQAIFNYTQLWRSYANSFVYTISGTALSVIVTLMTAYVLSNQFYGKGAVNLFILFTMFFSGGLIPTFLVMRDIGLYNNPLINGADGLCHGLEPDGGKDLYPVEHSP